MKEADVKINDKDLEGISRMILQMQKRMRKNNPLFL